MAFNHTFKYLLGGKEVTETKSISAGRAIRYNCLDCCGGSQNDVKECHITLCPLWPFRMGKSRPFDAKASERSRSRFKIKPDLPKQASDSDD